MITAAATTAAAVSEMTIDFAHAGLAATLFLIARLIQLVVDRVDISIATLLPDFSLSVGFKKLAVVG